MMQTTHTCAQYRLDAIRYFRLGKEGQGSDAMIHFIDTLVPILNANPSQLGTEEARVMEQIVQAQQRGDFTFVADVLEHLLPRTRLAGLLGKPG